MYPPNEEPEEWQDDPTAQEQSNSDKVLEDDTFYVESVFLTVRGHLIEISLSFC